MLRYFKIIAVVVLVILLTVPAAAQKWDFKSEFSLENNPNGDWSYGFIDKEGRFRLFNATFTDGKSIAGWALEGNPSAAGDITINLTDNQVDSYCTVWEVGQALIHPPLDGGIAAVRWTSPVDAEIRIDAKLTAQAYSTVANVRLIGNRSYTIDNRSLDGFTGKGSKAAGRTGATPEISRSIVLRVNKGDTLDLGISTSADGLSSAQVGLDVKITVLRLGGGYASLLNGTGSIYGSTSDEWLSQIIASTQGGSSARIALAKAGGR